MVHARAKRRQIGSMGTGLRLRLRITVGQMHRRAARGFDARLFGRNARALAHFGMNFGRRGRESFGCAAFKKGFIVELEGFFDDFQRIVAAFEAFDAHFFVFENFVILEKALQFVQRVFGQL